MMEYFCDYDRHLVCKPYSIENLHKMASKFNIGNHWFHGGKHPHYDIPKNRIVEIAEKCQVVTRREIYNMIHNETC